MLMLSERVRQLGAGILTSAGILGIVVGLAAQRSIANLLVGLQIAVTQPIRIDDVVIIENEWGRIEEITSTYVAVRLWDLRRLMVPLTYFIEKPFQNWTRTSAEVLGTVYLYTDYRVDVEAVRRELLKILRESELWDGRVWGFQVTDAKESVLELRALMSASDASKAWDLRCAVREKLVLYMQRYHSSCLPRFRVQVEPAGPEEVTDSGGKTGGC
jgi:small-conductance mechanosensitive channel